MVKLNSQQKKAVKHKEGPLLIVAGAGTGKTTVITHKIAHLIKKGYCEPEEILAVTFTEKAAQEMEERVDEMIKQGYVDLWISTFHAFCHRILENYGLEIGLPGGFQVVDETQAWLLVRQNLEKFDLDYYQPLGNPTKFIHALIGHFSRCKDEGIYPEDYLEYADSLRLNLDHIPQGSKQIPSKHKKELAQKQEESDRLKEIAACYHTYQKLLLDENKLDYGDLLNYTVKLFEKRSYILEKFQDQFKYILVDEFQDTNWIQYKLVKLLAPPQNNLTVCADDDQSIFMWRGASFNNVLQFRNDYPEAKEVVITKNYRSRQNILDFAYQFIQKNNPNRLEYQLNQVDEIKKEARRKGVDIKKFKKIDKKLKAQKKGQGIIKHLHFKSEQEEREGVARKITELLESKKHTSLDDFAILTRTNKQAQEFTRVLERANLPNEFLSSQGLYSKPIIIDVISYFKLLNDYHESPAVYRILNAPFLNIPEEDQALLTHYARKKSLSLYQALKQARSIPDLSKKATQEIDKLLALIKKHTKIAQQKSPSEIYVSFLQDSGYLDHLAKKETENAQKKINFLNQFYSKIQEFEQTQTDPRLPNFIEQINMELESGEQGKLEFDPDAGPETVKIMTIHSAKGLEFKYVFLPQLVKRRFPTTERKDPIEVPEELTKEVVPKGDVHLQEERRLFYVAMTRAKKGLFLTSAEDYGSKREKKPSRFLYESNILKSQQKPSPARRKKSDLDNLQSKKPSAPSQKPHYKIPAYFSFTQFAAFEKCPLQYKFAHILKIPIRGKGTFSFGRTIHSTLHAFVRQFLRRKQKVQGNLLQPNKKSDHSAKISIKELLEIYNEKWIDEWYESQFQKERYYKEGKKALTQFYQDFTKNPPQILTINDSPALEQNFHINLGKETITGKIDRIDKVQDNKVEIIDYKTGKPREKLKEADKQQLLLYQIAAEEALKLKPEKLTYYYLRGPKKISFLGDQEDKEKLKEKLAEQIETIKKSHFTPTPGWQCKYCDFRDICEYREEF